MNDFLTDIWKLHVTSNRLCFSYYLSYNFKITLIAKYSYVSTVLCYSSESNALNINYQVRNGRRLV